MKSLVLTSIARRKFALGTATDMGDVLAKGLRSASVELTLITRNIIPALVKTV
jgi:hypothetical protein